MTVTGIEEAGAKRVRVYVDGQFSFPLYRGELHAYGLREGREIPVETWEEIMGVVLPKRAALRCMNLLKARPYTEKQLREKLRQGDYPQELIDGAIEYVSSYGYIDDGKYAEEYITYHREKKSRVRLEQDLLKKGIDKGIIRETLERLGEEGELPDETAMAIRLLSKRHYDAQTASIKEKQKLSAWLYGKGFGTDAIRNALLLDITPN